jgi:ELWxxDGT repeat protein
LWKSDGTPEGTSLVADINPGSGDSIPSGFTNFNGTLFFTANDGTNGYELWKSDGTAEGTSLVADINPNMTVPYPSAASRGSYPQDLTNVSGTLFFQADENGYSYDSGIGLWKSDGTPGGTMRVTEFSNTGRYDNIEFTSVLNELTNVGGTLFFRAFDDTNGFELWKSDGTSAGTSLVRDIRPGRLSGLFSSENYQCANYNCPFNELTEVGGTLFFVADDGTTGREVWKSDGTSEGTSPVRDLLPGVASGVGDRPQLANVGGTLYFSGNDGVSGDELWKSDGTEAGTVLVGEVAVPGGSQPGKIIDIGLPDGPIFVATSELHGRELYRVFEDVALPATPGDFTLSVNGSTGRTSRLSTATARSSSRHRLTKR